MPAIDPCFIVFDADISELCLPSRFTFPFYYQPHALCKIAATQLQQQWLIPNPWQHSFGISDAKQSKQPNLRTQTDAIGKMFGVLVVKNSQGKIGFLAACSGKLADKNDHQPFVPPVFDMLSKDSFFSIENQQINGINQQINSLENSEALSLAEHALTDALNQSDAAIKAQQQFMVEQRKVRKERRQQSQQTLAQDEFTALSIELSRQSVEQKHQLAQLKQQWQTKLAHLQQAFDAINRQIIELKQQRKQLSNALQQKLFAQYRFSNALGQVRDLNDIFEQTPNHLPPAGAGECAAPKLLQYAYQQGYTPIAMAEFWWGQPPKSEVKQHGNFYPACHSKCRPILTHMLTGLDVDPDPLLINTAADKHIEIIFEDEHIVVINKPAEMLSVAGKNISDSVQTRMKQRYPNASGPLIVHRLDMSTSGLMVIALSSAANKALVQQFIERKVNKRYVALIDGVPLQSEGHISLPLRVDLDDRPKQVVCYEHGKHAETFWQKHHIVDGKALLHLYPKTGRTHQLRMHCAHHLGLGMPIVGDDLYGTQAKRLHLHAQQLSFAHPNSNKAMHFEVKADFE